MKELSIEQKAKAYDEAIERAKGLLSIGNADARDHKLVLSFFPELKESDEGEDEKIRKNLISLFQKDYGKNSSALFAGIKVKDILAWLEKQGEQKSTAEEVLIKAGLKPYKDGNQWCILVGDNIQEGICGFGDTIEDALYNFLKEICKTRQKPTKVEPKFKVGDIIRLKGTVAEYTIKKVTDTTYYTNGWSCSIERCEKDYELVEQNPVEWSDKDEEAISMAIIALENMYSEDEPLTTYGGHNMPFDKAAERLKSIRHQKQWKPNGDQIDALYDMIRSFKKESSYRNREDIANIAETLLEQLKAL